MRSPAMTPRPDWSPAERIAWEPAEKLSPSEWAERHAVIPDNGINPEPGPVSLERTPYLRGILDAVADPDVEELVFLKCTQVGFSTLLRLLIAYWIDSAPGPALVVLPDELSAKEWLEEDVVPTLEQTPRLRRHVLPRKKDNKQTAIRLAPMWVFAAWASSAQRLARRPIRYLVCDEVDKYPDYSGKEADPISLGFKRLSNWGKRARAIIGSSPTTRAGPVWKRYEACADKRHYQVPCPHCGTYQRLTWPQVKGFKSDDSDRKALAERIRVERLAYYECPHCQGRIGDHHKHRLLNRGVWASEGQTVDADGTVRGERPRSTRVGFHLSSLYSPWVSFSAIAAEFVLCEGDVGLTMDFRNSRLGEPFEVLTKKTSAGTVREKVRDAAGGVLPNAPLANVVPAWTVALIATADTQGSTAQDGWFPFAVRAWGWGFRSQLVKHGIVSTFEELLGETVDHRFEIEGSGGGVMQPEALLIDSGGPRWSEVYQFARDNRGRVHATKGSNNPLPTAVVRSHLKTQDLVLWRIDPGKAKDLLNRLMHDPDRALWMPNAAIDDGYCNQLAAEHKVVDPKTKKEVWVKVTAGVPNHFLDIEAMQCAFAFEMGAGSPAPEPDPEPEQQPVQRVRVPAWMR